ncbi:hypothetical protein C2G38_2210535 [Gigaspora rosea]|uniref:Uncharacterized protein n=1 Tax=Gigaspora rosea TaxID=44941 RepID=A0A397UEY0_9GLOM|nr:hypothetical protein C2G38_2210535 [Gigaspora rosea]
MSGSTNQNIHVLPQINNGLPQGPHNVQLQINNGQPQGVHIINNVQPQINNGQPQGHGPQNNANRINDTFINDLIHGIDPINKMQYTPQQDTEISTSLFNGTSFP